MTKIRTKIVTRTTTHCVNDNDSDSGNAREYSLYPGNGNDNVHDNKDNND